MKDMLIKKQEFRWSYQKKGTQVLNICTRLLFLFGFVAGLMGGSTEALANPTGGNVVGGSATITNTASELQINQTSQKALIEWNSFDIAAGETTHFYQPNANALALNRVVNSTQLSTINGNLLANGRILVINPNGVLIGKTGNVDTAAFIASSANIGNDAFMNGTGALSFNQAGNANASIVNQGSITVADEGLVALVAPSVRNDGIIQGNLSKIQLASGDTFGVDLYGDGLINLAVDSSKGARTIKTENNGSLVTNGGAVLMTAAAASNVVNSVINNTGVVQAQGLVSKNGEIVLTGAGAEVNVAGKLDASGANGGTVKVGGDYQGGGTLAHAASVNVAAGATIDVSGADKGGTAVIWSDKSTSVQGTVVAKGGTAGGLVETSSEGALNIHGATVDTSAAAGGYGNWLLDPRDVVIRGGSADGSDSSSSSSNLSGSGTSYTTTPDAFDIYESEIEGTNSNITIQARRNITTVAGGDGTVTLQNNRSLTVQTQNSPVSGETNNDGGINLSNLAFATTGSGSITVTGSTGSGVGNVTVGKLTAQSGSINLSTDNGSVTATGDLSTTNGSISLTSGNGGNISTKNLTVNSGIGDVSSLSLNSAGTLNVTGNVSVVNDDDEAAAYHSQAQATLAAQGNVNVTGSIAVSSKDQDQPYIGANSTLQVSSANGGVSVGGPVTVTATTKKTSTGGDGPTPNASATISAKGDVVLGGAVNATATSAGSTQGTVNSDALVSITSSNGGLWLAGAAPKAVADSATEQHAYTGSAYDHTTTANSGKNAARVILSGKKYTLNVAADAKSKTYDKNAATDPALTYQLTSGSLLHGDTFSGALTRAAGQNAGTYAITQGTLGAGVNYTINYTGANFVINPATLTILATGTNKVYDGTTSDVVTLTGNGIVAGDSLTLTYGAANFADKNVGTGKTVTVTGINASGAAASNYTFNTSALTSANITKRALTVSATGNNKVYDGTTGATVSLSDNRVAGDSLTDSYTTANFSDKNVGTGKTVSVSGISISGTDAGNYSLTSTTALTAANITKRALTVSATGVNKVYDGTTNATVTLSDNRIAGDSLTDSYTSASFSNKNVGTNKPVSVSGISISGTDAGNYSLSNTTAATTANITAATLTITALTDTKTYDGTTSSSKTPTVSGLKGSDTVTGKAQAFASKNVLGTGGSTLNVTGYTVNDGNSGGNYVVTLVSAAGTINPANLVVNAIPDLKVYDGTTSSSLTPFVLGLKGSDTVTGASQAFASKNVLGLAGSTLNVTGYTVNDGNSGHNYNVTVHSAVGTITPAALVLAALTDTKVYDGTTTSTKGPAVIGLKGSDTVTGLSESFDTKNAGVRVLTVNNGYTVNDGNGGHNYVVAKTWTLGSITPALLTIAAVTDTKVYDGTTTSSAGPTVSGLVSGDTVTGLSESFDQKDVGIRTLTVNGGYTVNDGNGGHNYTVNTSTASGEITPAGLTVAADHETKVYGDADPTLTYTVSGLIGGDSISGALTRDSGENVGSYAITQGTLTAGGNYTISYTSNTLDITKATLTIAATGDTKTYDGTTASSAGPTVSGLKFSDTVTGASQVFDSKNAGSRTLLVNGYTVNDGNEGGNYDVVTTTADGTINKATLTINATSDTKTYDGTTSSTAVATYSGLVDGDSLTVGPEVFNSKNAGPRLLYVTGYSLTDGNSGGNYDVVVNTAEGYINKANLTITVDPKGKLVGTADPQLTYTETGLVDGDNLNIDLYRDPGETVGKYAIHLASGECEGKCQVEDIFQNYNLTYNGADLTIFATGDQARAFFDSLGRPIISVADNVINYDAPFEGRETLTMNTDVSIKGGSEASSNSLANIEPAAGGDDEDANVKKKKKGKMAKGSSAKDLSNIEPAAGGNSTPAAPKGQSGNFACADAFLDGKSCTAQ